MIVNNQNANRSHLQCGAGSVLACFETHGFRLIFARSAEGEPRSAMPLLRQLHSRLESPGDLKAIAPGTVTSTSVPCWILLQNSNFPPILFARSRMPGNP